ncbi:MAG: M20/M25/M40 family metallo-hydrolase [Acidobacteriaceae bacterium]
MNNGCFRWIVLALTAGTLAAHAAVESPAWDAAAKSWWSHVRYLASDGLEGRETGSHGYVLAANYVGEQFKQAGLLPAGTDGFFQSVNFRVAQPDDAHSSWELVTDHETIPVAVGKEAAIHIRGVEGGTLEAQAVFVGYGFAVPERGFNELTGLDLRGKIAIVMSGGPDFIPGPIRSFYQSSGERWQQLQKAGAVGLVTIANAKTDIPWERAQASRPRTSVVLADPELDGLRGLKFSGTINPAYADKFLAGSGHSFAGLQALADQGKTLPKFPLAFRFRTRTGIVPLPSIQAANVIGLLPGSDAQHKHEYIIFSAHLDHLGIGRPVKGDAIYNGAMDNAAGIASLIEAAKALAKPPLRNKRSILFIAFTGEEEGMLGSQYFAAHPTVNFKEIVAAINMDMYLPLFPLRYLEVQGLGESTLGNDIRAVAQLNDVEVQFDKQPAQNRLIRSDQASFVRQGIPGLGFKFGWTPDSPEQKIFNDWIHERYHSPSDDSKQPIDTIAAAQFTHILDELVLRVANEPQRPQWYPESFYYHLAAHPHSFAASTY